MTELTSPIVVPTPKNPEYQAYRNFWKNQRNIGIYNALLNGITLNSIAEMHTISTVEVMTIITNKFFIGKLQEYLTGIIMANNTAKVIASEDVFNKLWARVKENVDDIPVEICLKELTKMLPTKPGSINIHNPKNVKINSKTSQSDLDDDFGFEGLPEPNEE
ncbi:MAG: hypothetical protein KKF08_18960 [Gammaproteobacteria bacterium]|nr:hypothetical protein [Gammaproteobacteria bacterium]